MHIRVLGRLSVTDAAGQRLPDDDLPRRARQILGVLAARHDRIQAKDALADAVWGDDLPANPAAAIEHYISVVRRRLQPGRSASESFIVTRAGGYVLDTSRTGLDLADLRRHVHQLGAHPPGDPERLRLHGEIVGLATDLPFPEDEHAAWTQTARNEVRAATLAALLQLSDDARRDDPARALRLAQEAIGLEPYMEQSYRAAMTASVAMGRPDEALRWYERCRQILDEDLGVAPAHETTLLHQEVLSSRLQPVDAHPAGENGHPAAVAIDATAPRPSAGPLPLARATTTPHPWPALRGGARRGSAVFVGRGTELDLLLDEAPAPLVHLVGPPGAGKSALLAELRRRAPSRVGVGHGPRAGSARALRLTWLRTVIADVDGGTDALVSVDAAMIQQRPLSLEELEVLAMALDRPEPVVLAVDEASDLDETSVAELAWLGRRCALLSVVLTYRYPSTVTDRPIEGLGTPIVLRLAPLADVDMKILDDPTLGERTGGIPALVGAAHRAPEVAVAVAMEIARSRTRWMPEACWEMLRLSAALGPLRPYDLAVLTGRPLAEVLTYIDQLIHAHLLTEDPGGLVRHRSSMIRAAVAEQVSSASGTHLRERLAAFGAGDAQGVSGRAAAG
jgi:DNA-binding SARP family transcriptional activator